MNATRKVIGIDFGSSQSSIAIMEIGSNIQPELLNVGGGRNGKTMPTILALDKNDDTLRAAGNEVPKHYREVADASCKLVSDFKRYLGSTPEPSDSPEVADIRRNAEKYAKTFLREMARIVERRFNVGREGLSPDDYATCIAYPASWSDERIRLLKELVKEAGFPADPDRGIYSLPEPVAAVHSLRMGDGLGFRFGDKPEHFMVIDFGGGTLDVCVIQTDILGRAPKIVSTAGDPELGGKEFDEMIERIFFRNNGDRIHRDDLSMTDHFDLRDRIKEAKEAASEHFTKGEDHTHPLKIRSGQTFDLHLYRNEFANMVKDAGIYDKIKNCLHAALDNAGLEPDQITKVVLTGGSSRWFFLREIVAKEFALGGERIFLTETPFTDVATGCAVSIGLSDQAPKKDGIWVKYRLSEEDPWSEAKCLLAPGRNDSRVNMGVLFLGELPGTKIFTAYRIYLSWWRGFEKSELKKYDKEAVIELFANSNGWFSSIKKKFAECLLKNVPIEGEIRLEDRYKVYLEYNEDETGVCTYRFEIVDHQAAKVERIELTQGPEAASQLPQGKRISDEIIPGYRSYAGLCGLRERKLVKIKPAPQAESNPHATRFHIRFPWKKK